MGCFSKKEIADAARLHADARSRIDDIARRTETAATPQEHTQLGRERAGAFGDLKAASFVLTEDGGA
ncbi:hypothetical protein OG713_34750 [Streptomyces sp. NBC_00723]|uniref:hypothetical protein n=1 Tax=Streptomyces sp. NBC_00723 TaxID=2903673 RepID=UPI00386F1657